MQCGAFILVHLQARLVINETDENLDSEDNNHFQNHNSEMYFTRRQFEQPAAELETNMLNVSVLISGFGDGGS